MDVAPVVTDRGTKETGKILLIVSLKEAAIIVDAVDEYAGRHKRSHAIQAVKKELESCPVSA